MGERVAGVVEMGTRTQSAPSEAHARSELLGGRPRVMMVGASGVHEDPEPGRWVVETKRDTKPWEVIVEPDSEDRLLVVITAYPVDQP